MVSTELRSRIALLYRRAGFGARPEELDAGVAAGYAATVDRLVTFGPDAGAETNPPPQPATYPPPDNSLPPDPVERAAALNKARQVATQDANKMSLWWLDRMVTAANPLQEKLTLFWHGHFATSIQKVVDPGYMLAQNQIFRSAGAGNFGDLTLAVAKDPAMLIWLDANSDRKASPNENFARELLELFTVGIGHYSEDDVKAGGPVVHRLAAQRSDPSLRLRRQPARHRDEDLLRPDRILYRRRHRPHGHRQPRRIPLRGPEGLQPFRPPGGLR